MTSLDLQARALRASKVFKSLGLTQKDLAKAIGASQPQVSRILNGHALRQSRLFDEVCIYAENIKKRSSIDALLSNRDLVSALQDTWDGTPSHAAALAAVIRSLTLLSPTHTPYPTKKRKSR